jgi:hypothetical protein
MLHATVENVYDLLNEASEVFAREENCVPAGKAKLVRTNARKERE